MAAAAASLTLTEEQSAVIQHLLRGENLFLTGGGGVGKSYLLGVIATEFPQQKRASLAAQDLRAAKDMRIQLTAMTGCAALLLGHHTKTLHSWSGVGLGKGTVAELYTKIRRNTRAMRHWLSTDLLVIDEVSMLTVDLFDKLNALAKKIRGNTRPFGGIQVLLVGDFYQLPPVVGSGQSLRFAFESDAWREVIGDRVMELTVIQRQQDTVFQQILREARVGALSKASCRILRECQTREWNQQRIRPTLLFPKRADVDMINEANMKALVGEHRTFHARLLYDPKVPRGFSDQSEDFQRAVAAADTDGAYAVELELIVGAQVMMIANVDPDNGLVNGSRGVVSAFCPATGHPIVEFVNGTRRPVGFHSWPLEDFPFCARSQIPLRLAWAYTIHKCQGSTVDSALIDIGAGIFEYGQAYVALSRLRSLDALYVYDFDPTAFRAHPRVRAFYSREHSGEHSGEPATQMVLREELSKEPVEDDQKEPGALPQEPQDHPKEPEKPEDPKKDHEESPQPSVKHSCETQAPSQPSESQAPLQAPPLFDEIPSEDWKRLLLPVRPMIDRVDQWLASLPVDGVLPARADIWNVLRMPLADIRVVILGQDPYPTPGHAHGYAFSVPAHVQPLPPSLKNIYKELVAEFPGTEPPPTGCLQKWIDQGVFLLNTALTVAPHAAGSHLKVWEPVTDAILRILSAECPRLVVVLWGKAAQAKKKWIDCTRHAVIEAAHPSPLSASKGFFGSRPFHAIQDALGGDPVIHWS